MPDSNPFALIHTFVFDGDEKKDFIRGLGLSFAVPMREQVHNRHVRFSGEEDGLWAEPVQPATGRRVLNLPGTRTNAFVDQLAGKRLPNREAFDAAGQKLLHDWAVWNDYQLIQASADGFSIQKRVNAESCWLDAAAGHRASGLVFAGDVSGGLGVGLRNFWQSHPTSLEVRGATTDAADIRVWLWSPDAPADGSAPLRPGQRRRARARSRFQLRRRADRVQYASRRGAHQRDDALSERPAAAARRDTRARPNWPQAPPLLVATPQHIHATGVFGIWSLPDRSTPAKRPA